MRFAICFSFALLMGAALRGSLATGALGQVTLPLQGLVGNPSDEETELDSADVFASQNANGIINALNSLLKGNPKNATARVFRAEMLGGIGRVADAQRDLSEVNAESPFRAELYTAEITFARNEGNPSAEITALNRIIALRPVTTDPKALALLPPELALEARLSELRSDYARADAKWLALQKAPGSENATYLFDFGDYQMRRGLFAEAAQTDADALKRLGQGGPLTPVADTYRLKLIAAQWAANRPSDALEMALTAVEHENDMGITRSASITGSALFAWAISAAGVGSPAQRAEATGEIASLAKALPPDPLFADDLAIAAITGRVSARSAAEEIEPILKSEPNLDWALWDCEYLIQLDPGMGARLKPLLPPGSVQRAVLEKSTTQPASRPATP